MKVFPASYPFVGKNSIPSSSTRSGSPVFRLNHIVIAALLLVAIIFPLLIAKFGLIAGVLLLIVTIGLPVVYSVVVYPEAGIVVLLIAAYLVMWVIRMGVNFPLGTLMDALQVLLLLGFFIKQKVNPDWSFIKTPTSKMILIWILYNILEVANSNPFAWLYTIRTVAVVTLLYFVFVYQIRSIKFIRTIIKLWLALALFAAIYGFKQHISVFLLLSRHN